MILRRAQYELASRAVGPFRAALDDLQRRRRKRPARESPFAPPLESLHALKSLMTRHYYEGRYADGAVPVAWVTSGFPVELLRPLGFHTVYPENHAAMCGVQRLVAELSDAAEREGYSRDLCSYARADLGSVATGRTPAGRLPRPDLLACCTNICQTVLHWYRALAERFRVPLVVVDTPFVCGEAKPHHLAYVERQLGELVSVAERVAGRRLVDTTMAALDKIVTTAATDPRKAFKDFDKAVPQIDDAAKKARKRGEDIKARGQAYFKAWEKELASVNNAEIRRLAEERKAKLEETFGKIRTSMEPVRDQFNTWLADLKDLRTYLSSDLTIGGVDAAKDLITKTKTEGQGVQQTMDKVIGELNTIVATLTPAKSKK